MPDQIDSPPATVTAKQMSALRPGFRTPVFRMPFTCAQEC
jgi:hypothetical protein